MNKFTIKLRRICESDSEEYRLTEKLLVGTFPQEEYRELSEFRELTRNKRIFHNNLICDGNAVIGFVTYWDLGRFYYIEHFAMFPEMRNKGYGNAVLTELKTRVGAPIVLEVEPPDEETARRRIGFYGRHGFALWKSEYTQPPYRAGGADLSLFLMAFGDLDESRDFAFVKKTIYREVYNCEKN